MGIGKSRVARSISEQGRHRGALVLWGAGQEDLSLPYLPITTALATISPAGSQLLDLAGSGDGEGEDPAHLWRRAEQALLDVLGDQPVVLVIDDLQWTDPASQSLLLHLLVLLDHASAARRIEVLTILTVRTPVDDERTARTVARLEREPSTVTLSMAGLSRPELRELLGLVAPAPPTAALVEQVVESSGGNPLLAEEVLRSGLDDQRLRVRAGSLEPTREHLAIDLRTFDRAVSARIDRVSPECRTLLATAALLGEPHDVGDLAVAADLPVSDVDRLLEEAVRAEILLDHEGQVAFAHPQVRHVLFHTPSRRTREQLHLRIADRLEARGDASAAVIAHHLTRAGAAVEPARLCRWSQLAAEQALAIGAWSDAAIAADTALAALGPEAPWDQRADLHLLVSRAASHDFDLAVASRHGGLAVDLAEAHGDVARWGAALIPWARTLATNASDGAVTDPTPLLRAFLTGNPDADDATRAEMLALLSEIRAAHDDLDGATAAAAEAAAALPDDARPGLASSVAFAQGMADWARLDLPGASDAFQRAQGIQVERSGARSTTYAAVRLALVDHLLGHTDVVAEGTHDLATTLRDEQIWGEHALLTAAVASAAVARGELDRAEHLLAEAELSISRSGFVWTRPIAHPALACARALRGDGRGAAEAIERSGIRPGGQARYRLAIAALLGDLELVRSELAERPWRPPGAVPTLRNLSALALQAEVAGRVGDGEMAAQAVPALTTAHEWGIRLTSGWVSQLSRLLAGCHLVTGDTVAATHWMGVAVEEATAGSWVVELARLRLLDAQLAQRLGAQPGDIAAMAGAASLALDEVGALPLAAEARRLGRFDLVASGPTRRVILFTDLVGSTALNVRTGDAAWVDLVEEHDDTIRACLRRHGGVEFKHTGDGIGAWFTSPADAVDCAMQMGRDLERASAQHPDTPLMMRAGVAMGEPVEHGGDLFGLSVVRASRLCDAAADGTVLVSDEVADAARGPDRTFRRDGARLLKGFPDPVGVHTVITAARPSTNR
jgi:class 3 adenylate cyclase